MCAITYGNEQLRQCGLMMNSPRDNDRQHPLRSRSLSLKVSSRQDRDIRFRRMASSSRPEADIRCTDLAGMKRPVRHSRSHPLEASHRRPRVYGGILSD